MPRLLLACLLVLLALPVGAAVTSRPYALPSGGGFPHDVAVSADGVVWYTAQRDGKLGRLDPASGRVALVPLGVDLWILVCDRPLVRRSSFCRE